MNKLFVADLYETEGKITQTPINSNSKRIPSTPLSKCHEVDIIINDIDREYGRSEIEEVDGGYVCILYKHRLPINEFLDYNTAVSEMWDSCPNCRSDTVYDKIEDSVTEHFDWWLTPFNEKPGNIPVFRLSNEQTTQLLLDKGFESDMLFIEAIY